MMREYVRSQTAVLVRRLAYQVVRSSKEGSNPDSVHDLRVAIRRLRRCLQVFRQFFPGGPRKKIRRRLSELMQAAGGVRDLDIAIELVSTAGLEKGPDLTVRLTEDRARQNQELMQEIRRLKMQGFSKKWRNQLDLP